MYKVFYNPKKILIYDYFLMTVVYLFFFSVFSIYLVVQSSKLDVKSLFICFFFLLSPDRYFKISVLKQVQ